MKTYHAEQLLLGNSSEFGRLVFQGSSGLSYIQEVAPGRLDVNAFSHLYLSRNGQEHVSLKSGVTEINSESLGVRDNLTLINSGEVGSGVTYGGAGFEIDRGLGTNYQFAFDESDDKFKVGFEGNLEPVVIFPELVAASGVIENDIDKAFLSAKSTYFHEPLYSGETLTGQDIWETESKISKLFTKNLYYSGEALTGVITIDEINSQSLTKVLSYSGDIWTGTSRVYS